MRASHKETTKVEKIGTALNVGEKTQFSLLIVPYQATTLMPMNKKFMVETTTIHEMTRLEGI